MRHRAGRTATLAAAAALTAGLLWPGDAAADFRHQRIGARPKALGSAYVSLAEDANAAYWNPAGLVRSDRVSLMLTRAWLYGVSDIGNDYVAATLPKAGPVSIGASWMRLGIDNVYSEDTINLALAVRSPFLDRLALGVAGKMFILDAPGYEQYNDPNYMGADHAFSFDLGFLYDSGGPWTVGGTVYNVLKPKLQLISTTSSPDPVYGEWALGGSYKFRDALLLTVDLRNREGEFTNTVVHGGAEIWFYNALVLRTGLDMGMVTLGAGLQDKHWQADFTVETDNKLGNVYMLSFTLRK
ncbi:MAG TPA: hypothetical protein PLQ13_09715 [Candidatus Krumholzibacteria bacterium]|nr:hypothetical protein [Candidatus Krumholzibacteria bacterium]